jgi:tetratricopeptide (TPR) repeat protein
VYKVLGDIYYNSKQWAKAEQAYQKAIELKSTSPGVRVNMLWCFVEQGKYLQAIQYGKACIANGDETPEFYRRTAEACFRGKRFADSIPLYEHALKGFANDLYLMEHLRQASQVIGDYARAKRLERDIAQLQGAMTVPKK